MLWTLKRWFPTIYTSHPFKVGEYYEISRRLAGKPQGVLLDLGCGGGLQTILLSRRFRSTIGVDIRDSVLSVASNRLRGRDRDRIKFLCGDLVELELSPASVDAVVSLSVLQLIPHWQETLKEIFRLLKAGGQMVVCVDSLEAIEDPSLVLKHRKDHSVQHYFSERDLAVRLKSIGFRKVEVRPFLTSAYAAQLFSRGIRKKFEFGRVERVLDSLRLRLSETWGAGRPKGVYLIADAIK